MNYYFAFAGNFHAVINQILQHKNRLIVSKFFRYLIEKNTIFLDFPRVNNFTKFVNFASDATEHQLAALEMDQPSNRLIVRESNNILVNELKAALLSLQLAKQKANEAGPLFGARLYIDTKQQSGSVSGKPRQSKRSEQTISIFQKFNFLKKIELFKEQFPERAVYIPTAGNNIYMCILQFIFHSCFIKNFLNNKICGSKKETNLPTRLNC